MYKGEVGRLPPVMLDVFVCLEGPMAVLISLGGKSVGDGFLVAPLDSTYDADPFYSMPTAAAIRTGSQHHRAIRILGQVLS